MAKTPVIKIEKLFKEFGSAKNIAKVLNDIDLDIWFGEFVILFGPSGCGKSTLLNCIAGLEMPTSGKVLIRGTDISKLSQKQLAQHRCSKIGMVFQQFNVLKTMNVQKNVAMPLLLKGVPRAKRMKRAENLLKIFEMEKFAKNIPTELSGGQQQRVAIARSLANNPWIILADEPTGNLDSKSADEIMDLFQALNQKSKRTIILVTHNPDYLHYADKIVRMKDGQIVKIEVKKDKSDIKEENESEDIKL